MIEANTPWSDIEIEKDHVYRARISVKCPRCGLILFTYVERLTNCECGISWRFKIMIQEAI